MFKLPSALIPPVAPSSVITVDTPSLSVISPEFVINKLLSIFV
jgi:hypothetical protein